MPSHRFMLMETQHFINLSNKMRLRKLTCLFLKKSNLTLNWKPDAIQSWALFIKIGNSCTQILIYQYFNTFICSFFFHFNKYIHYFSLSILYVILFPMTNNTWCNANPNDSKRTTVAYFCWEKKIRRLINRSKPLDRNILLNWWNIMLAYVRIPFVTFVDKLN